MKKLQALFYLIGLSFPALTWSMDLVELYQLAEERDPAFRQVVQNHLAVLERKPQARALLLPSINLRANSSSNEQSISAPGNNVFFAGETNFNAHGYTLDLRQPLFRRDRYLQLGQADTEIQQAASNIESARQSLIVRIAEAYFNMLSARDNLDFAMAEQKSLSQQLEQAKLRFDVGMIAITDVQEAQAGYDSAIAKRIRAQNDIDVAAEAMREIIGEYTTDVRTLNAEMPLLPPEPLAIEDWTNTAQENNLDVVSARFDAQIAKQQIKIQDAGHYPTLDLVASKNYDSTGGLFGSRQSHTTSIGLELAVPIFEGGLTSSLKREAVQRYEQSMQAIEQNIRSAHRQTREAYLNVTSGISEVKALKQAQISSETALEATEAGFEVGTRTAVDVVSAEQTALQAKQNHANARYQYVLNSLRLKQAAGTLSIEDLLAINNWLN